MEKADSIIREYVNAGYQLTLKTEGMAQLVKPKKFNSILAFLGLFTFGIVTIICILSYLGDRDKTVLIEFDKEGNVTNTTEK
jgi:hypothetical protein